MSDRPDFTANTALNAVADTLDNLPVSINAQTLGSLAVDIAAQSAGEIDINLSTNSAGDIDINIQDQTDGVETGTEFAARQGDVFTTRSRQLLGGNSVTNEVLFDNNTGGSVILEALTMSSTSDFTQNSSALIDVSTASPFTVDVGLSLTPMTAPFLFTPGIRLEDTGKIEVELSNNASNASFIEAVALFRDL